MCLRFSQPFIVDLLGGSDPGLGAKGQRLRSKAAQRKEGGQDGLPGLLGGIGHDFIAQIRDICKIAFLLAFAHLDQHDAVVAALGQHVDFVIFAIRALKFDPFAYINQIQRRVIFDALEIGREAEAFARTKLSREQVFG